MTRPHATKARRSSGIAHRRQQSDGLFYGSLEPRQMLASLAHATVVDVVRDGGATDRPDQWQTLDVQFSQDVNVTTNSLRLFRSTNAGAAVDLTGVQFSYNEQNHVASWDFANLDDALTSADYSFLIDANRVSDIALARPLDGDGDGNAGDSYSDKIRVVHPGDVNRDGKVDVLRDAAELIQHLFGSAEPTWDDGDFNDDSIVDILDDAARLIQHLGQDTTAPQNLDDGAVRLPDRDTFNFLAHRDNVPGALNVRELKFLITEIDSNAPRLHFVNANTHPLHYNFYSDVLDYSVSRRTFDSRTYFAGDNRTNLAGTLISHENYIAADGTTGLITLETWPTDPLGFGFINQAFELIAEAAPWLGDQFAYHPVSETQRDLVVQEQAAYDASNVNIIQSEELFGQVTFQAMNQSESYGRLVLAEDAGALSARDIPIFKSLPNDLATVAGIITEVPQTPLSHVNLKARQNNTPNAYITDAANDPNVAPFLNQLVYYRVGPDGFEIRSATQQEVDDHFESLRPAEPQYPARDLSITQIQPLSNVSFADRDAFGSKAVNVAELQQIMPDIAPDGYAIPFYFYDQYMTHNGFYADAELMMADAAFQNDPFAREAALDAFRRRIRNDGVMPVWMYDAVSTLQASFDPSVTPRLRSSANAEDLAGFTGAGLYNSYTHHADEGHLSKSVKQVWASLWTFRGFEEREFYRVDHLQAAMGVLVHPNYSDELANGVAVTKNIFDPIWEGYYINVQVGEDLITNPNAESIPEEMLVADLFGAQQYEIQYIRNSNLLAAGQRVMARAEVLELVGQMRQINQHFASLYGFSANDPDFVMEIEFKITSDGNLAIKQARPWVG